MSIGSCGNANGTCIYIADTGDNEARTTVGQTSQRSQAYRILKFKEPNWKLYTDGSMLPSSEIEVLEFNYLHASSPTPFADSESMFVDHAGWGAEKNVGDLYVITKWDNVARYTYPRVFYIPVSAWGTGITYSPEAISNGNALLGGRWTRADMTYDGKLVAVGDVNVTHIYTRCPGASVDEALAGAQPCYTWNNPVAGQMESFAWSFDGTKNIQIAEGSKQPMAWTMMSYDTAKTVTCPDFVREGMVPTLSPGIASVIPVTTTAIPNATAPTTTPLVASLRPTETPKMNDKESTPTLFPSPSGSPISGTPTWSIAPSPSESSEIPVTDGADSPSLRPVISSEGVPVPIVTSTSASLTKLAVLGLSLVVGLVSSTILLIA